MTSGDSSARFERLFELLDRALQLDGAQRAAFLDAECGSDLALRAELEVLLAKEPGSSKFLEPPIGVDASPGDGAAEGASAPHVLGEYEIERELGRGATGVVYLARQRSLKRQVALKVLSTNLTTTAEQIERFHREAQAVAKLRHTGIVKIFAHGRSESNHWFAMEYVEGHDLAREIELQRHVSVLPSEQPYLPRPGEFEHATRVARLVAEVARALHTAHEAAIVHRDVKPQNLLLQPDGVVRVGDFGLARDASLGSISVTQRIAGTPHYMSPEQAHVERAPVDHRTDVYSLGVVLYELCTLRRPYEGKTVVDIFDKIRTMSPPPIRALNRAIPRDLETICSKAMAKLVDERYRSALEFAEDLERFLAHEAIYARPQTKWDVLRRWLRRHRVQLGVAAAVVLALVIAITATQSVALAGRLGDLTVRVVDSSGTPQRGAVALRRIDEITGIAGPPVNLGSLPITSRRVEPGYYRIVAQVEGHGLRSYTRWIERGAAVVVAGLVHEGQQLTSGMVVVPATSFELRDDQPTSPINERKLRLEGFLIDAYEVSVGDYRRFLAATGHPAPRTWSLLGPEHDQRPVVDVTWNDALAYAEWAGKRIPSFAEWSLAARGTEGRLLPWSSNIEDFDGVGAVRRGGQATDSKMLFEEYLQHTEPVDAMPQAATPSGIHHMLGNVAEWTESLVAGPSQDRASREFIVMGPHTRIIAGQSWSAGQYGGVEDLSFFNFMNSLEPSAQANIGFRCVKDMD